MIPIKLESRIQKNAKDGDSIYEELRLITVANKIVIPAGSRRLSTEVHRPGKVKVKKITVSFKHRIAQRTDAADLAIAREPGVTANAQGGSGKAFWRR